MTDEQRPTLINQELTAEIVAAYLRRNQVTAGDLSVLILAVHEALGRLSASPAEPEIERTPAVTVRRSITPDFVVCLDCGWRGQMLRRHLTTAHGLSVAQYRARWKLSADHAMTAPAYSQRRSTMAKQLGLGRSRTASAETLTIPEPGTLPSPKRRGRPRSKSTSTGTA